MVVYADTKIIFAILQVNLLIYNIYNAKCNLCD